jgi:hypothetical protein
MESDSELSKCDGDVCDVYAFFCLWPLLCCDMTLISCPFFLSEDVFCFDHLFFYLIFLLVFPFLRSDEGSFI